MDRVEMVVLAADLADYSVPITGATLFDFYGFLPDCRWLFRIVSWLLPRIPSVKMVSFKYYS